MSQNLRTFGLSIFIVVAFIAIAIGLLIDYKSPVPWVLIAVLAALPYINKRLVSRRYIAWNDQLAIGIKAVDDDHQKLISLMNNLQTAIHYPTGESFERQALNDLVAYTKYHFQREEEMMEKNNYPEFAMHKAEHQAMVAKVGEFLAAYEDPRNREQTVIQIADFLQGWLVNHIMGSDHRYAPYLKGQGVS
jgi:hemerythrin